jgi:restriction endonuclease Mrr
MPTLEEFRKTLEMQQKFVESLRPKQLNGLIETMNKIDGLGLAISKIAGINAKVAILQTLSIANTQLLSRECQKLSKFSTEFNNLISPHGKYNYIETDFLNHYTIADLPKKEAKEAVQSIIVTESSRIKSVIANLYNDNEKLYSLSGREFEVVIQELLNQQGFDFELTKQTRDGGFDLFALKYVSPNLSPIKYLVECKRNGPHRPVGVEVIRSFKEVIVTEGAHKGIIATTSYFTTGAIKKKNLTPYLLDFVDKDELLRWINNYLKN